MKKLFQIIYKKIREVVFILLSLMMAIAGLIIGFGFLGKTFIDTDFDTTSLTSYGFAILLGCATICFSWSKTIDDEEKKTIKDIRKYGEQCFFAAISFLIASLLKYVHINRALIFKKVSNNSMFFGLIELCAMLSFVLSFGIAFIALLKLFKLLFERINVEESETQ